MCAWAFISSDVEACAHWFHFIAVSSLTISTFLYMFYALYYLLCLPRSLLEPMLVSACHHLISLGWHFLTARFHLSDLMHMCLVLFDWCLKMCRIYLSPTMIVDLRSTYRLFIYRAMICNYNTAVYTLYSQPTPHFTTTSIAMTGLLATHYTQI